MTTYDIQRLALTLAIQAEIEGMKADNAYLNLAGHNPNWTINDFNKKAEELRNVAYSHDHQL